MGRITRYQASGVLSYQYRAVIFTITCQPCLLMQFLAALSPLSYSCPTARLYVHKCTGALSSSTAISTSLQHASCIIPACWTSLCCHDIMA